MDGEANPESMGHYGHYHVNSMLVHLPEAKAKKAYVLIKVGDRVVKTTPVKSRSGEMVFVEGYETLKNVNDGKATF